MVLSECVVGVCFQERSRSCVKQMVVGDPSPSIPVYGNICSSILVSESLQLFFFFLSPPSQRCAAATVHHIPLINALAYSPCALPRREASSLWDLREDVLPVGQQERPHEKEARRGGAQRRRQRNRFVLSHARCARRLC